MAQHAPFVGRVAAVICRMLLATARVKAEGLDDLPQDGPLIIIANHISNADPPLVFGWLTPALGRQMHILAKEALFVGPIGWFLRSNGITPVKAGGSDIEAYRVAKSVLDRGEVLCIFPEGTRSATGLLQEPKPGVAMLATRSTRADRRRGHLRQRHVSGPWQAPAALRYHDHHPRRTSRSRSRSTRHFRVARRWPQHPTS